MALAVLAVALVQALLAPADSAQAAGNSITSPDTLGGVGQYTSLALDGAGNPVVSYRNDGGHLKVLHCDDPNCSGGGESITSPDITSTFGIGTSLVLDSAGMPVVVYWSHESSIIPSLRVLHCDDANCAPGGDSLVGVSYVGFGGRHVSLALDGSGNPVFAFQGGTDLEIAHCNSPNCALGGVSISVPDLNFDIDGAYPSLALDSGGNPVVSYFNQTQGALKVLHCNDPNCVFPDSITTPHTLGNFVTSFTSLVLDSGGRPVVAYHDSKNGDLNLLHCDDANCAPGGDTIATPDLAGNVGSHTSLALDSSGNPVVTYYDETNVDLKVLHCNDPNCAGADESITAPDTGGLVGQYTSLALDGAGNPVVSYWDTGNDDLKLLHCGDATCKASAPISTPTSTPVPAPTETPTPTPPSVGGISLDAQLLGSSGGGAGLLAGAIAIAAAAVALGGGVWYVRRRRVR